MVYRKESLLRRIEKLKGYQQDLESYGDLSFEKYASDRKTKYAIERILFLVAENILDFLDHILSARFSVVSDGYEDILENAFNNRILDREIYEKLKGLGGFRNILAHEYLELDDREVYRNFLKMKDLLSVVMIYFETLLSSRPPNL